MIERTQAPCRRPSRCASIDPRLPTNPAQDLSPGATTCAPDAARLASHGREHRGRRRSWQVDVRRTMRASLQTGGVPLGPEVPAAPPAPAGAVRALRRVDQRDQRERVLPVRCCTRCHDQFRKLRSFVFVERISEVTDVFERERSFAAVSRKIATDAGWRRVGYTDYGRVWLEFLDKVVDDLDRARP
jgi:uncharacterized protein with von Willebrand factor type A (vWA) domain